MEFKSLEEWQRIYEKKTGEKVELEQGHHLFYLPTRGFASCSMDRDKGFLIVGQVCGNDGDFWFDFVMLEAESQNLPIVFTYTIRNIKSFLKVFKVNVLEENENEKICRDRYGKLVKVIKRGGGHIVMFYHNQII